MLCLLWCCAVVLVFVRYVHGLVVFVVVCVAVVFMSRRMCMSVYRLLSSLLFSFVYVLLVVVELLFWCVRLRVGLRF